MKMAVVSAYPSLNTAAMKIMIFLLGGALLAGLFSACGDGGRTIHYQLMPDYAPRPDVDLEQDARYVVLDQQAGFESLFRPLNTRTRLTPTIFQQNKVLGIIRDFHTPHAGIHITGIHLEDQKLRVAYNDTLLNNTDTSSRVAMVILIPSRIKFDEADFYENGQLKAQVTKTGIGAEL
ncbi:hypothetical protein DCC81_05060 [Chitinophaga parva]|uniref:Uncharacterized protein n=2 Tax=Chitinophaga parva TaxID=2169414 RepID=A0A2T7BME4_9BACT|nr:hypothetical protein DCC81_05060 [Chitinophaga parva]